MRRGRQGWIMPEEDIPSMLQMIEAKIASSEIEFQHRSALIRLRAILEDHLQDQTGDSTPLLSAITAAAREPDQRPDS